MGTIKYDKDGNEIWFRRFGQFSAGYKMKIDKEDFLYIAGESNADYALVKYDIDGNLIWARTYNGPANSSDRINDMILDSKGNVIVTGQSHGIGTHWDYATVKYSPDGDTLWVRRYNGPAPTFPGDYAYAITVDDNDNVYVTGWSDGENERAQCFTIAYSHDGDSLWSHRYPEGGVLGYACFDIAYDQRGFIYVVARSNGNNDTVIKYDLDGNLIRTIVYNTNHTFTPDLARIALDKEGNIYLMSHGEVSTRTDYIIVKYSPEGEMIWEYKYPGVGQTINQAFAIFVDEQSNIYITGENIGSLCPGGGFDYLTIKLSQDTTTSADDVELHPSEFQLLPAYPNPFNSATNITFTLPQSANVDMRIYNILGEEIATIISDYRSAGTHTIQWDAGDLPSGLYLCKLQAGNKQRVIKLLLMK
jgi:hypothetical protein